MDLHLGLPQAIYIMLTLLGITVVINNHGKEKKQDAYTQIIATALIWGLLIWGGFFSK